LVLPRNVVETQSFSHEIVHDAPENTCPTGSAVRCLESFPRRFAQKKLGLEQTVGHNSDRIPQPVRIGLPIGGGQRIKIFRAGRAATASSRANPAPAVAGRADIASSAGLCGVDLPQEHRSILDQPAR
jgi:hypothetical protein